MNVFRLANNYLQLVMQKVLGVSEADARALLAKWAAVQLKAARGKLHELARKLANDLLLADSYQGGIYDEDYPGMDVPEYRSALIERTPTKCFTMTIPITDAQMLV